MTTMIDQNIQAAHGRWVLRWWLGALLWLLAWLLVVGIVLQIFFVGSALLVDGSYLAWHKQLGSWLAYLPMGMVVAALAGRLPRRLTWRALLLLLLYVLQFIFVYAMDNIGLQSLRGLHAVNALALFIAAVDLVRHSWHDLQAR